MVIQEISITSKDFPEQLREIAQPPKKLYIAGELPTTPMLAIVGSRKPTDYGRGVTYQLAYECARAGLVIVSGLAVGLDTVAHTAALEAGGKTVAVLGGGLDRIYPATNTKLAEKIITSGGAVISEYPAGAAIYKANFVARNRIEAGLSLAVLVTEAAAKSGTLITANFALTNNRQVLAVPGNVTSLLSAGPNNLIRSGATPVTSSVDILNALGYDYEPATTPKADSPDESMVLQAIGHGATATDQILATCDLSAAELAQLLSLMEITGKIRNLGAGHWAVR